MTEKKEKVKLLKRVGKFFKEIRMEMKKVVWPTRKQLINNTLIVLTACFAVGIVIWVADAGLTVLFSVVFGKQ